MTWFPILLIRVVHEALWNRKNISPRRPWRTVTSSSK